MLVHGLFADGSCWSDVIGRLQSAGLNVTTLEAATESVRRVLARTEGPTVLVGHSFAGTVISEVRDAHVVALGVSHLSLSGEADPCAAVVVQPQLLDRSALPFDRRDDPVARFGQDKTVRGALEERVTDRLLECAQTPADGRMARLERTRGAAERAGPRDGQEDSDVTPFHRGTRTKLNAENTIMSLQEQI
ncbi:hypothetical protein MET9862_03883 [Methylobacterium symbioticum]|uniref:AB hydrolase-1 domain-containing protein n=1 Tax=Methylobacterium symbioticum TaxID=2584084 RepID=A0A509EGI4_9HYPH|nr:hypothetical protein MET9862_03883 [Methylobacterium symbioticum]